jgi:multiple sugar transport system ATP-binding protein
MASVVIRNAVKVFGATKVLHGVNIEIPDQSFAVLVGPSGCGKSTLLRMIAGLEEISDGEILIGDEVVNRMPPKQRDIAMVFQNYALYPHMTVFDNMAFSLKLAKTDIGTIRSKVEQAAGILNLRDYLERYPRQLSGGQRQRVAMGRAIVRDPRVFLFDEPLSNLDAKLRVQMRTEIRELHQRLNSTSVYVTHDQIEAMTMGDQIVVMRDGNVEQAGAPLELYDNPYNVFVATFIGSPAMNMLSGKITDGSGRKAFETNHGVRFPLQNGLDVEVGRPALCGVRPEHFTLAEAHHEDTIDMDVAVVEPTGAEVLVIGRSGGQEFQTIFRERHNFKPGQKIYLTPKLESLLLFDEESGRRIR